MISCRLVVDFLWWINYFIFAINLKLHNKTGKKASQGSFIFFFFWCKWPFLLLLWVTWCSKQERQCKRDQEPEVLILLGFPSLGISVFKWHFILFGSCFVVQRTCLQQDFQLQRNASFDSRIVGARLQIPGETEIDVIGPKMYIAATRCDFAVGPTIFPSALEITPIHHPLCFWFILQARQVILRGSKKDSFYSPLNQWAVYSLSKASVSSCWTHPGSSQSAPPADKTTSSYKPHW